MKKIGFLVFGIIGMLVIIGLNPVLAANPPAEDQTPFMDRWIDTVYRIDFINMTTMNINVTFAVHEICIDGSNFTADSIMENYTDYPEVGMEIINKTKDEINNAFNSIINTTFANDTVISEDTLFDESSLVDTGPANNSYQSPINFTKNAIITFNVTSFGFEENPNLKLNDVINGTLKMGAAIDKAFTLKASAGYNNTFIITVPDYIKIVSKDEDNSDETATWTVDNLSATNIYQVKFMNQTLTIESRSPNPTKWEEVQTNVTIDMHNFDELYINGTVNIKSVNITKYNVSLPSNIRNLSYISSDGLRMALDNALVKWEDIENEINNVTKGAEKKISDAFNTTIIFNFTWYNKKDYDLSTMSSERPINATFIALNETNSPKIKPNIFGDFDAETITGVLNAGAKYTFEIPSSDQNYTLRMIVPENILLSNFSVSVEHTTVENRNAYSWESSETLSCTFESEIAPEYNESRASLNISIDINNMDILRMLVVVDLNVDAQIYHINISDVSMPKNLTIKYINSDCLRLLYRKGILKQSDIDNIIENMTGKLEERLSSAFGENITIEINRVALNESLEQSYDINNMSDKVPVSFSASTHIELRLSNLTQKQQGGKTSAALTLFTIPIPLNLTGIKGWDTTYKLILPPELKIASVEDRLGKAKKYTENGRDVFEVSVSGDERYEGTINIDLTPLLLLFIVPGIVLSFMIFFCSLIIKIMGWREDKFIKKNF